MAVPAKLTGKAVALFALSIAACPAQAEGIRGVLNRMDAAGPGLYRACPADRYKKSGETGSAILSSKEFCSANPLACYEACVTGNSHAHCFQLALNFQADRQIAPRYAQMLFTAACAAGRGSGCTNRAAGIRNGDYDDDPYRHRSRQAERCTRRSFAIACQTGDAWGCAMLGQSWQRGEGGPRSLKQANSAYKKSCAIAPDFAACDFARNNQRQTLR